MITIIQIHVLKFVEMGKTLELLLAMMGIITMVMDVRTSVRLKMDFTALVVIQTQLINVLKFVETDSTLVNMSVMTPTSIT